MEILEVLTQYGVLGVLTAILFYKGIKDQEKYDKKRDEDHNKYDALLKENKQDTEKRIEELKIEIRETKENNRNLIKNDSIIKETEERVVEINNKVDILNEKVDQVTEKIDVITEKITNK